MGLAIGIAWIIFGVCYMVYKYCNEDLRMSSLKSLGVIVLGFVAFFALGGIASGVQWLKDELTILYLIIIIPIAIGGCVLIVWLIAGDVKDAIKDGSSLDDVMHVAGDEITHKRLYTLQQQPPNANVEYLLKIRTIQKKWFESNDVYLTFGEAVAQLRRLGCEVVIDSGVMQEVPNQQGVTAAYDSIEFEEWIRRYGVNSDDNTTDIKELNECELYEAELMAMSPAEYVHLRDSVGNSVLSRLAEYAQKYKGGIEEEDP